MPKQSLGEIIAKTTAHIVCLSGMFFHGVKLYVGENSIPPITHHVGDFALVAFPIFCSKYMSSEIEYFGRTYNSPVIEKIGHYISEIVTGLTMTYFVLGESVLPQILPGTSDPKDIPAVLVAGICSYVLLRKK